MAEISRKEAAMAYLNVLFQHVPDEAEQNHRKHN
jgi:hypothetical protein